jgi:hypothetical protein
MSEFPQPHFHKLLMKYGATHKARKSMAAEILIVENDPGIVALPLFRPNKRDSRGTEILLKLNSS